jgi:hypothetical protein
VTGRAVAALGSALLILAAPAAVRALSARLINRDGPGEGFNDSTPVEPVGGNVGTTLGEQRLLVFQRAVDIWAAQFSSPVEVRIGATFDPLQCDAGSVTLGMAGPVAAFHDFAGAPLPRTLYPSALADSLAGIDLDPGADDIEAQFNSAFGTTCNFPGGWYYGFDGQIAAGDSDFLTVVLHELGHGLGFLSFVDIFTGARLTGENGQPLDDAFMPLVIDDRSGRTFVEMTDAERAAAIVATGHLKWDGASVVAASGVLRAGADGLGRVQLYAPPEPVDGSSLSHWSDVLVPNELMEPIFTQPIHVPGLANPALLDMGWRAAGIECAAGDCDGNAQVSIAELITAVRIALGEADLATCTAADVNGDGRVSVNELIAAVGAALNGCSG